MGRLVFAWVEPTAAPPSGNVEAPVNEGDLPQTKTGAFGASTIGASTYYDKENGSFYVDPDTNTYLTNLSIGEALTHYGHFKVDDTGNLVMINGQTYSWPSGQGTNGYCLHTSGSPLGNLTWSACGGAGGTPGGADTQVQFNDSMAFQGDAGFVYNKTTDTATLGTLNLTNALTAPYGGTGWTTYTPGDILYASNATTLSKLGAGAANNGKVLTVSGGVPSWAAVGGTGTVTSIGAGTGLTSSTIDPITASGILNVGAGAGITVNANDVALNTLGNITTCTNGTTNKIIWDATNNRLLCATDQAGGGGGSWTPSGNDIYNSNIGNVYIGAAGQGKFAVTLDTTGATVSQVGINASLGGAMNLTSAYTTYALNFTNNASNPGAPNLLINNGVYGGAGFGIKNFGAYLDAGQMQVVANQNNYGLWAQGHNNDSASNNYGVYGRAYGSSLANYGLYGTASGGTTNWGLYINAGNAYISGNTGIGTTAGVVPAYKLDVNGNLKIGNTTAFPGTNQVLCWMSDRTIGYCAGSVSGTGACTCTPIN